MNFPCLRNDRDAVAQTTWRKLGGPNKLSVQFMTPGREPCGFELEIGTLLGCRASALWGNLARSADKWKRCSLSFSTNSTISGRWLKMLPIVEKLFGRHHWACSNPFHRFPCPFPQIDPLTRIWPKIIDQILVSGRFAYSAQLLLIASSPRATCDFDRYAPSAWLKDHRSNRKRPPSSNSPRSYLAYPSPALSTAFHYSSRQWATFAVTRHDSIRNNSHDGLHFLH